MSPSVAVCATCGHVLADREMLDPCPACGGTERTLRREGLVVDRSDPGRVEEQLQIQERRPDGTWEIIRDPLRDGGGDRA